MAFDLKLTHANQRLARKLASGVVVEQEGLLMCHVIEDGVEKATIVAAPVGTERVIGFSMTADSQPDVTVAVEEITVPAASPYEVEIRNNNLVSGRVRVLDIVANTARTIDLVYAGAAAAGTVKVDLANGKFKFNLADAGVKMRVTYLYSLTLEQSKQLFGERFINNRGLHASFGEIELGCGLGELYTDQFDASQDYAAAASLKLGANGIITAAGAGPVLNAVVVSVPSIASPKLGIRFNFLP